MLNKAAAFQAGCGCRDCGGGRCKKQQRQKERLDWQLEANEELGQAQEAKDLEVRAAEANKKFKWISDIIEENRLNYVQEVTEMLKLKLPGLPDDLLELYTLLVFTTRTETVLEDVHDAWAIWRNKTDPKHKSLKPFDDLALEVQELDRKYAEAIVEVAQLLNGTEYGYR